MDARKLFRKLTLERANWLLMAVVLGLNLASQQASADTQVPGHHALDVSVCAPDGVALGGYDLVSYFSEAGPQAGLAEFTVEHNGLLYRFTNEDNRADFVEAPQQYLPSYRGWCSTNLSMGRLACPDYTNYKIEHGRLLFFERVGFTNGLDVWNSDPLLHRRQADQNFVLLSKTPMPTQP